MGGEWDFTPGLAKAEQNPSSRSLGIGDFGRLEESLTPNTLQWKLKGSELGAKPWPKVLGHLGWNKVLWLTKETGQLEVGAGKLSCHPSPVPKVERNTRNCQVGYNASKNSQLGSAAGVGATVFSRGTRLRGPALDSQPSPQLPSAAAPPVGFLDLVSSMHALSCARSFQNIVSGLLMVLPSVLLATTSLDVFFNCEMSYIQKSVTM